MSLVISYTSGMTAKIPTARSVSTETRLGAGATTWSAIARAAKTHTRWPPPPLNQDKAAEIAGAA